MHFTLPLYYFNGPLHMFRFMQNHHQGVSKLHIFTSTGISVLIVMQQLSVQLPFTFKIRVFWKTYTV
jgi:hypothetical protein